MLNLPEYLSIEITHNDHKVIYEDIKSYIEYAVDESDWVSADEKTAAIKNDSLWQLCMYDRTPVGYITYCASTLEAIINKINKGK